MLLKQTPLFSQLISEHFLFYPLTFYVLAAYLESEREQKTDSLSKINFHFTSVFHRLLKRLKSQKPFMVNIDIQ